MTLMRGFYFDYFANFRTIVYAVNINDGNINLHGKNFHSRKTLSFGFYRRTVNNSQRKDRYKLHTPIPPYAGWRNKWYFGVNYRIKCEQAGAVYQKNVDYADFIASDFINKGWILIPHYINGAMDQGVDFFKIIPDYQIPQDKGFPDLLTIGTQILLPLVVDAVDEAKCFI